MDWKRLAVVVAAVLVAGYIGARLGLSDRSGQALAGGGGNDQVIAFTHDYQSPDGNLRLFLINTAKKKIMIYCLRGNAMGLAIAREYKYDEELLATPANLGGLGLEYLDVQKLVEDAKKRAGGGGGGG